ncbi:TMEM165/GDT1 family protein [Sphingomonas sp. ac-8]|uniref:TMEM165/GDT1 family protein n=1 Tax=Sphingomonas sp. ac-8 TaxID=3242977 RepID=UPI003A803997
METLVPAFVAVLIAQLFDPPARLAAVLGDRFPGRAGVFAGVALAQVAGFALAAGGGAVLAAGISPSARTLVLALALLAAGGGGFLRLKLKDRLETWRIGGFATALLGVFILAFGDRSQFLALGFATWGGSPGLALAGAGVASVAAGGVAVLLGERAWCGWPQRPARIAAAALFLIAGLILALRALRLV